MTSGFLQSKLHSYNSAYPEHRTKTYICICTHAEVISVLICKSTFYDVFPCGLNSPPGGSHKAKHRHITLHSCTHIYVHVLCPFNSDLEDVKECSICLPLTLLLLPSIIISKHKFNLVFPYEQMCFVCFFLLKRRLKSRLAFFLRLSLSSLS